MMLRDVTRIVSLFDEEHTVLPVFQRMLHHYEGPNISIVREKGVTSYRWISGNEGRGGRFCNPAANATISIPYLSHHSNVS